MLQQHVLLDFSQKQEKHLLCCANGVVDLRQGKLLGPPTPDHFMTQICPVEYDPSVDLKPAIDFFEQFFPVEEYPDKIQLVRFMQQFTDRLRPDARDQPSVLPVRLREGQ